MVNAFQLFLVVALVGVAMWGQHWYDQAHRLKDTIMYMVEDEADESRDDAKRSACDEHSGGSL